MDYSVISEQGKRKEQQDTFVVDSIGNLVVFGVFDGHGGKEASVITKKRLVATLTSKLHDVASLPEALRATFLELDKSMHEANLPSGTTATVAVLQDKKLTLAHVGDSRAVFIRGMQLQRLTIDHSLTDPNEMAKYRQSKWFTEKSSAISKGQVRNFKLTSLSRSLGDQFFEDAVSANPDIHEIDVQAGDTIILATDGLWHFMSEADVLGVISASISPEQAAKELIHTALAGGGTDNITVGVISI